MAMKVAEKGSNALNLATSKSGKEQGFNSIVGVALNLKKIKKNKYVPVRMKKDEGEVFSFLPLDMKSRNSFHVNAGFVLASNRKQLHQVDSLAKEDIRLKWNTALLEEEIPDAFILLLESITDNPKIQRSCFDDVWPEISNGDDLLAKIPKSIYSLLAKTKKPLFQSEKSKVWITWSNVFVADFDDIVDERCREVCQEILLTHLKSQSPSSEIVKLSKWSKQGLKEHGLAEKSFDIRRFYIEAFLPIFETIDEAKRKKVLLHMLSTSQDQDVLDVLKGTRCITTMQGQLRKPADLVDKSSGIAELFLEKEDVFPAKEFSYYKIKKTLRDVGMKGIFDSRILEQRILFISREKNSLEVYEVAQKLIIQSEDLWKRGDGVSPTKREPFSFGSGGIFSFFSKKRGSDELSDSLIKILKDHNQTEFVPTSNGEIMKPCEVWETSVSNFVSYSRAIINLQTSKMDREWSPDDQEYFKVLGLQSSVSVQDVVNQLKGLAAEDVKEKINLKHRIEVNLELLAGFDANDDDLQGIL